MGNRLHTTYRSAVVRDTSLIKQYGTMLFMGKRNRIVGFYWNPDADAKLDAIQRKRRKALVRQGLNPRAHRASRSTILRELVSRAYDRECGNDKPDVR